MSSDLIQLITNQTGAVAVAGIFAWYIHGRDKRDERVHRGYMDSIDKVSERVDLLKDANEAVYSQNFNLHKDNKQKNDYIKKLEKKIKGK